jgi:hypothetical protein
MNKNWFKKIYRTMFKKVVTHVLTVDITRTDKKMLQAACFL